MPGLDDLSCQRFRGLLNGVFGVHDAFGASVRGPRQPALAQQIWRFEHPAPGAHDLFAVPLGPDGEGMLCDVIFNRVRSIRQ
jgi:hypothetical protein